MGGVVHGPGGCRVVGSAAGSPAGLFTVLKGRVVHDPGSTAGFHLEVVAPLKESLESSGGCKRVGSAHGPNKLKHGPVTRAHWGVSGKGDKGSSVHDPQQAKHGPPLMM